MKKIKWKWIKVERWWRWKDEKKKKKRRWRRIDWSQSCGYEESQKKLNEWGGRKVAMLNRKKAMEKG